MVELDQGGRLAGRATVRPVPAALAHVAASSFVLPMSGERSDEWRIVPDANPHVLVHLWRSGSTGFRAGDPRFVGVRSVYTDVPVQDRVFTVGIRLLPGSIPQLTGTGAGTLRDRGLPLSLFWPGEVRVLQERLSEAANPERVRLRLLGFLAQVARAVPEPDWRVRGFSALIARQTNPTVEATADRLGIAARTLRKAFGELVGLTPKRVIRIQRIHDAARRARLRPDAPGGRVAAAAGFADQPHMIREFHSLLGESPRRFGARRSGP